MTSEKEFSAALAQVETKWVSRFDDTSALLAQIKHLKEKVDEEHLFIKSAGIGRVQQKIRICKYGENEIQLQLGLLSGLLIVVALAAFATYKLHQIADYQVLKQKRNYP